MIFLDVRKRSDYTPPPLDSHQPPGAKVSHTHPNQAIRYVWGEPQQQTLTEDTAPIVPPDFREELCL